ncbi:DUF4129 domain-containing protein [Brachybacterium sp. J153]|uniref:DUF4129 domain-containing protein n=1 Tax=Brachybacterium sp. J153 TaxID=3116488 RepID=UPI002E763490|nr:DUF4129 domain-containing protein [Brachybacterium sp. J153]MEE1619038.1 DUF4129 domain-containing protein [Brachybacterium sp. J153]
MTAAPDADLARRRRLAVWLLAVLVLVGTGIVMLGASADRGPAPVVHEQGTRSAGPMATPEISFSEPDFGEQEQPTANPVAQRVAGSIMTVLLVLLGLVAAAAVVILLWRLRSLARPGPLEAEEAGEEELTVEQARAALDDARELLGIQVDAQDAVIAAWLAVERAIAAAGVRRDPAQTTLEFVVAVLGTLDLDQGALDRLAHLYRRALFDPEPLAETDRGEAATLLDTLLEGLDEGAAR